MTIDDQVRENKCNEPGKCHAWCQKSHEQLGTDGRRLRKAGSDHRKFIRQIFVSVDITAPLYWWKEYDTYKVATVANSTSTMHKIHSKAFELDDFSHDHLTKDSLEFGREEERGLV